jgi:hypothetical protein
MNFYNWMTFNSMLSSIGYDEAKEHLLHKRIKKNFNFSLLLTCQFFFHLLNSFIFCFLLTSWHEMVLSFVFWAWWLSRRIDYDIQVVVWWMADSLVEWLSQKIWNIMSIACEGVLGILMVVFRLCDVSMGR